MAHFVLLSSGVVHLPRNPLRTYCGCKYTDDARWQETEQAVTCQSCLDLSSNEEIPIYDSSVQLDGKFEQRLNDFMKDIFSAAESVEGSVRNDSLLGLIRQYDQIIEVIKSRESEDGIARITQIEIGQSVKRSQTSVSNCLRHLEIDDCVKQVARGQYQVNHTDLFQYGPFPIVFRLLVAYMMYPELYQLNMRKQMEILNLSKEHFQIARGILYSYYTSPSRERRRY